MSINTQLLIEYRFLKQVFIHFFKHYLDFGRQNREHNYEIILNNIKTMDIFNDEICIYVCKSINRQLFRYIILILNSYILEDRKPDQHINCHINLKL